MKNFLNNLLNWVLKKGSSETKKDQVSLRAIRYAAVLFMVLMVGIGNAWAYYTPSADEVIILSSDAYDASKTSSGYSKHSAIAWGGTASTNSKKAGDPNNGGAATSSNVNCYSVKGNGSGKNITVSITGCSKIIVYHESHSTRYLRIHSTDKDGTVLGSGSASTYYTELTLTPATSYTLFLEGWDGSAQQDFNVYAVKLIKGSSCAAANLTAANITSNGDQIVGTGITFTKVGNPASGDTWYWQTSSTGTDKTYNASSAGYSTATTAGSYTVYLRAYNTAADCWGTAASMTNTIISCPFDVYNGENVDKGNKTASGWTINNSTNMAKTSGSSNGYSYWYQAGSANNYVQFDGSIALVSGDQIKIQWTHTNGSNKTLQLTINGSSASLTSGSQASSSTLVEAVYDVTSTTTVTSIKLNSSGSSGCIIYQVSIVKAACAEPSCSDETGLAYGTGTVNKTYGDGSFTNTLTNSNSLSVTYSSSNTNVATVNESTGAVTIAGAGTTTITATWAGNATYCADEVSYTLNVKPAVGSVSGAWDRFGGETISLSVTPSGGSSYTYQWQKWYNSQWNNISNGADGTATISGATTNNLQISTCHKDNSGSYRCQVTAGGQTNETDGHQVKVYVLECYNSGTTVYNFTRDGNNQRGSLTIDLAASTNYGFKVHADNDYYGNNGTVYEDVTNWVCSTDQAGNLTIAAGLGGTFTITMDYSASVGAAAEGIPEVSIIYPRKTIYFSPGVWNSDDAKFAFYYFRKVGETTYGNGWTGFITANDCGSSAEIPQWNGVKINAVRLDKNCSSPSWGDKWNQTSDITITSNNYVTITDWGSGDSPYTYGTYSIPTYTISYNAGTGGSGSKASETKTCGVAFTLPNSAVFTRTGYTQTGWTTSDGGAQEYALGGTYTTNEDKTFYPVWSCITPEAPAAAKITATDGCSGSAGATFSADDSGKPSYVTWYWQTASDGTSTSYPVSSDYETASTAGSKTMYVRAKNTACDSWSTATSKSATVKTAATIAWNTAPADGTAGGSMTASVTSNYSAGVAYAVTSASPAGCVTVGASTGVISYVAAGTATIRATVTGAGDYCSSAYVDQAVTVTAAAVLTALEADVLYQAQDMANVTLGTDTWFAGLSTNNCFKTYGDGSSTSAKGSTISSTNVADDISTKSFTSKLYIMTANNRESTSDPTKGAIEIITPSSAGVLYLYLEQTNSGLTLKKQGTSTSESLSGANYKAMNVDANTHYFINGAGSNRGLYGIKYVTAYSVSITNTNLTKVTGETGSGAAIKGKDYTATFTAPVGYTLPSDATVSIGGTPQTKGSGYTWTISDGTATLTVPAAKVTGAISIAVSGVAAESYSITYHCNGAESGCPSDVAAAYTLPSPLPTGLTKDGYDFGGWFTDSECTAAAVAGAALTDDTDLYAKWTERGSECEDTPHAWNVIATSAKSYKVRISKVTEEVAIPVADATASNLTAYAGSVSTNDNVTVQIADGGSSKYGYKFDGSNTYLKLVFSTPLVLNDTLVVGMTNASHNISFTTTAVRSTTLSTSGGKLIIPAALAGQSTIYLWRGSGSTMYLRSFAVKHECEAIPSCTTPTLPTATLSNQTVCEGSDIAAWDATPTNASTISGKSESISYSWKKKGSETVLGTGATFDLGASAAESQAGTYVVTVTVSKAGYTSASASKEVDLTVTESTEVTSITADKATVYPGNSVTLTATANITPDSWQWYTCTNAEGDVEAIISGAESASYTIASAGAAGTYYYKAKATGDCGTAEAVYTLTVSAAAGGDCETEIWVIKAADLPEGATAATHITTPFTGGSNETASITIDGNTYTITQRTSNATGPATIVVPEGNTATLYILVKGNNGRSVILEKGGVEQWTETPEDGWQALSVGNLAAGTYSLRSSNNLGWGLLALKLCSASACSDPEVTASADNTTACVGSSVTFTAANAHASATYQWQKLDGTWTNISGKTASTYNIASVVAGDAGKYRVIASHDCNRTSNEVTLTVASTPVFGAITSPRTVMETQALSINDVEASDATTYRWYKSANNTYEQGTDAEVGTAKNLTLASGGETSGATYYLFCIVSNSCGSVTSSAIQVNVTTLVEEDCATKGNEGSADFGFENTGCSNGSTESTACYTSNSRSKYLTYTAPEGKYFDKAKVTVAVSSGSKCGYAYSTDGSTWTYAELTGLSGTLTEKTIDLTGNITHFRISRNLQDGGGTDYGVTGGTFYLSKVCFEYTESCTATEVARTAGSASYDYTYGSAFTKPTFALRKASDHSALAGTLNYSSSNENVASVDDNGDIDFTGVVGSVTITVAFAGGTISEIEYCASQATYTINVTCSDVQPKITTTGDNISCQSSITLNAVQQNGSAFADGSFQWYRDGEAIDGATSASYIATRAGLYTVSRTATCTKMSSNSANITNTNTEPEVERLTPFQYYHVDKVYRAASIMRYRHLFAVKGSTEYNSTGKNFKMELSRNGGEAVDVTTQTSIVVTHSADNTVDTVLLDLNALNGKYNEGDELVLTCKAVTCGGSVSDTYKESIEIHVIGSTPTLALICSGANGDGTRTTKNLVVGGDFLTGYNKADLCQQTGNTSFDANTEWGLYTELKEAYIVTPVNGYAVFNKLNYEPFDILLLTDYPKASKSDAAKDVLDDMAALCDYRPMLSFKTHMVAKSPSKWAAKGFTTSPVVSKEDGRLNLNIVCYAHPMFASLKTGDDVYTDVGNTSAPLVYTMLTGAGYESSKGMQGFELAAAENFVTIGLTHYNATIEKDSPDPGEVEWTPGSEDRMLVTVAERQTNPEARFILFSLNCGAQSKLTDRGEQVVLACLNYLLGTAEGTIDPADCSFTFDNGDNNEHNDAWYASNCPLCTGTKGDGLWTTAANWGPDYRLLPGEFNSVRIKKPVEVNDEHAHVMEVRIIDEGRIDIPAGKALDVKSTIRRMDGTEIYPTEENDIHIGSASTGNGTLIFNNDEGDTKARVDMYSKGFISEGVKNYQYIGTPFSEVNALYNYYGSWIYSWSYNSKKSRWGWVAVKNGGPMHAWTGYCISQESPTYYETSGTMTATGTVDIVVPAGENMVVGNSWTAPIDINALTTDDLEGLVANIYFFNTGVDKDGTAGAAGSRYVGGTYVTVPVEAARYEGEDDHINSMQGFFVKNTSGSDGTLHLDYDRHVRGTTRGSIIGDALHAPARRAALDSNEPEVLKIKVSGENYDDKLLLLAREDFTEGFDNGWDGDKWDGNESALYIYTTDSEGTENSVSAVPELEGTIIGFRAGEDDAAYTLHFECMNSDETLFLYDSETNMYTQILNGATYRFFTNDKEKHARFIITRNSHQISTDIGNGAASDGAKVKKFILSDKMYIMINGLLYDATGKLVK